MLRLRVVMVLHASRSRCLIVGCKCDISDRLSIVFSGLGLFLGHDIGRVRCCELRRLKYRRSVG